MHRSTVLARIVALLLAFALIAAACGGDDDTDTAADGGGTSGEDATGDAGETVEATDDTASDPATGDAATAESTATGSVEAMTPVIGGELTYLLEAESDTWDIPGANCAVACITVMRTVVDPLAIVNEAGEAEPFLAESIESNADFTEWTITMREGITFHDGTPADGAAVQRSLQEMASGALQGQVLVDLVDGKDSIVLVDPMTVSLTFKVPFATFIFAIAERTGWLIAPSFWDDPDKAGALMVGTGPFVMSEWNRGESTVVTKNPEYWRTDANGTQLPYLDSIVFRPVPDVATRRATMESGDADLNQDSFGENLEFWETEWVDGGGGLLAPTENKEVTYLMFNNGAPPFDDPDLRRALALCTNVPEYIEFRSPGNEIAFGPFAPGTAGYLEDTGFPQFDPEAGNALLDEIGRPDVINYGTTNVPSNLLTAELFADMWSTNCGLNVNIDQFDQSELITRALTGAFEVFLWRNHGQGNPGLEYVWWHSRHAAGLALNFGKIVDPAMDALLQESWTTNDPAELDRIAQEINTIFGENVYNLWLNVNEWALPYQANVHGVGVMTLESGNLGQHVLAGRTWLHEAWKEG